MERFNRKDIAPFLTPDYSFIAYANAEGIGGILAIDPHLPPGTGCDNGASGVLGYRINLYMKC